VFVTYKISLIIASNSRSTPAAEERLLCYHVRSDHTLFFVKGSNTLAYYSRLQNNVEKVSKRLRKIAILCFRNSRNIFFFFFLLETIVAGKLAHLKKEKILSISTVTMQISRNPKLSFEIKSIKFNPLRMNISRI
jgi:hypothetical protein